MLCILFAVIYIKVVSSEDYMEVNITQGLVRGYKTSEGIFAFYGIPYATAPTGEDKFKAPLDPPTWTKPFEATERYIACPQKMARKNQVNISMREDCLITNIYVPDIKTVELPVVVIIHGGAYQYGYGDIKTPIQLVKSKKIIAVNFNYRLSALGFLCLGTKNVPGNAGMKDQVALLRWVRDNIEFFGGNPNDVTLYGCSAGGSAVDLHLVSKMSNGLFKKAIPQSGANVAAFSVQPDPVANAKMYAKLLNLDKVDDIEALEEFYLKAPMTLLTSIDVMERFDSSVVFTPCIERDIGEEMFLDTDPEYLLQNGLYQQLPVLYGFTDMEGLLRLPYFDRWKNQMNKNFSQFLPENLYFESQMERENVAQKIKHFYFGSKRIDEQTIMNYIYYFTDITFTYGMLKSIKLQTEAGNDRIYFYEYSFPNNDVNSLLYNLYGAGHCAQSNAVLDESNEKDLPEEYQNMKTIMRKLWLNFMITGTPVTNDSVFPDWPPAKQNRSPHMSLNTSLALSDTFSKDKRAQFWDKIYSKYNRRLVPPTF